MTCRFDRAQSESAPRSASDQAAGAPTTRTDSSRTGIRTLPRCYRKIWCRFSGSEDLPEQNEVVAVGESNREAFGLEVRRMTFVVKVDQMEEDATVRGLVFRVRVTLLTWSIHHALRRSWGGSVTLQFIVRS